MSTCVALSGSTVCPAFGDASVATDVLPGQFGFLSSVTDVESFDQGLEQFIGSSYVEQKYQTLFGCTNIDLDNTTSLYARYTYSFICNAIVQNSIAACDLTADQARPLCADTCADFALSEQTIVSSPELCDSSSASLLEQLRADFTNCALPAEALTTRCLSGSANEGSNCGFQSNLAGLCEFCRGSTQNATDSCCVTSQAESRCVDVELPVFTSMQPLFPTPTPTPTPTGIAEPSPGSSSGGGLSGGQIAGIVIGSIFGALLLLALLICCCIMLRRRGHRRANSSLNQPSPPRSGDGMVHVGRSAPFEALPGARVTRMTALEGNYDPLSPEGHSSGFDTSPESQGVVGSHTNIPMRKKASDMDGSSPETADYSSPEGTGPSERMSSFKDYYSHEEIHSGDFVSTLWAYQPRAPDEFELERGDMLKIVGIWDDGWATGVRVRQRAEDWVPSTRSGRDSVVSADSERSQSADSDIRAFPLVCVCLPQHWRRTIEGEPSSPQSE